MKKALSVLLAGTALTLSARQGRAWVAGHVGQTMVEKVKNTPLGFPAMGFKGQPHCGLGICHWYSDRWGLDLMALRQNLKADKIPGAPSGEETHRLVSDLFNFRPGAVDWYPRLVAGIGGTNVDKNFLPSHKDTTRLNYHADLGLLGKLAEECLLDLSTMAELRKTETGVVEAGAPAPKKPMMEATK